eukprot:839067-Lingulodinium_polyedra.AAC.1
MSGRWGRPIETDSSRSRKRSPLNCPRVALRLGRPAWPRRPFDTRCALRGRPFASAITWALLALSL